MGKRKRNDRSHGRREESNFNAESRFDSVRTEDEGKSQSSKGQTAGQGMERNADLSSQSGAKRPHTWTSAHLMLLLKELSKLVEANSSKPLDNSSVNWNDLAVVLGEKLNFKLTRTQVYEKGRRLKEKYIKIQENASFKDSHHFKNKDDKKMFSLMQRIWGDRGSADLQTNSESCELPSGEFGNGNKQSDRGPLHKPSHNTSELQKVHEEPSLAVSDSNKPDQELDDPARKFGEDGSNNGDKCATNDAKSDAKADSQLNKHKLEGDIKNTIEYFHAKQQALLKDLENSCIVVLKHMEAKFLNALSTSARESRSSWMEGGTNLLSFELLLKDPVPRDNMADECNQSIASESLARQWQQQHLQELNLTSLKLELMLEECKKEKERLEKL